jgi:Family of unknown function (DUF6113)
VLRHAAALLLGALVALASVAVHRSAFPFGLLLAVVTTYAVPWWLLRSTRPRTAASYVAGWLVLFAGVVTGRPEGDFVMAQDVKGLTLMLAGLGLVVVGVVSLTRTRPSGP